MISVQDIKAYQYKFTRSDAWMSQVLSIDLSKYKRLKSEVQEATETDLKTIEKFLLKEKYNSENDEGIQSIQYGILQTSDTAHASLHNLIQGYKSLIKDDGMLSIPDKIVLRESIQNEKNRLAAAFDELSYLIEKS